MAKESDGSNEKKNKKNPNQTNKKTPPKNTKKTLGLIFRVLKI